MPCSVTSLNESNTELAGSFSVRLCFEFSFIPGCLLAAVACLYRQEYCAGHSV